MSFLRSYKIKAGGLDISSQGALSPLNVEFDTNASITSQQDTFTIKIWNLSEGSRSSIEDEFSDVELHAGYEQGGSMGLIAKGELRSVVTERQSVNMVTIITAGSGDKGCQRGKCNKTMSKNATAKDVLNEAVGGMENVSVGEIKGCDMACDKTYMTIAGNPKREMNKLAKRAGFDWYIEKQKMYGLKKSEKFGGETVASADQGMIGGPREDVKGVSVDCLLKPDVRIGTTLRVESRDLNRSYKIIGYTHKGSFYGSGSNWMTTIHGESADKSDKCGAS